MVYVLICPDCGDDQPPPFRTSRERTLWADAHMLATGHVKWRTDDELADW